MADTEGRDIMTGEDIIPLLGYRATSGYAVLRRLQDEGKLHPITPKTSLRRRYSHEYLRDEVVTVLKDEFNIDVPPKKES